MPRLIPHDEVMSKLAALQEADRWGRQFADDRAVEQLAKTAGAIIAQSGDAAEAELEKYAMSMVDAGDMSFETFQMLKEAGFFGKLLGGARKMFSGAGKRISGLGKRMKSRLRPKATPKPAPSPMSSGSKKMPFDNAPASKPKPKARPSRAEMEQGWGNAPTPAKKEVMPGVYKQPPKRAPAEVTAKPKGKVKKAPTQEQLAADWKGQHGQAPAAAPPAKQKWAPLGGWGKPLALAGTAALGYGAYRAGKYGLQQMESVSGQPMAYGGGWSPTPYGYGYSPYGHGTPTMGRGG
jgi:hypothetical protein